jgi:hypothetical protein
MPLVRRRSSPGNAATPDKDLAAQAQRGDREAFAALYDRYLPRVYGYCYRSRVDGAADQPDSAGAQLLQ